VEVLVNETALCSDILWIQQASRSAIARESDTLCVVFDRQYDTFIKSPLDKCLGRAQLTTWRAWFTTFPSSHPHSLPPRRDTLVPRFDRRLRRVGTFRWEDADCGR